MNELITTSADNTRQISLSWHLEVIFYHFPPSMPLSPPPQPPIISQEKEDGTASIVAIVFLSSCIFRVKTAVCVHPPTPLLSNHKIPHWKKNNRQNRWMAFSQKRKEKMSSIQFGGPQRGAGIWWQILPVFAPKIKRMLDWWWTKFPTHRYRSMPSK